MPVVSPVGEMSFLAGAGEMAGRIRRHDWASHPFGPPGRWPQALRAALGICLNSAFPTSIYWGPELRLLYNDSWAPIPGPRHPGALGAPAREVWADIWHVIEPQFAGILASGEGLFVENQLLPMRRYGVPEETYWSYSFTPIRGGDGAVAGIFNSGSETTRTVLSERQMQCLIEVDAALGGCAGPDEAPGRVVAALGRRLGTERVLVTAPDGDGAEVLRAAWRAGDAAGDARARGAVPPALAARARAALAGGRAWHEDDTARLPGPDAAAAAAEGFGALAVLPWPGEGGGGAAIWLGRAAPRAWHPIELATVRAVAERLAVWTERLRAAEREAMMIAEVDHRARNVLAVALSVVRLTEAEDIAGFRARIEDRIGALARAHALLAAERWQAVDLRTLVAEELAPYAGAAGQAVAVEGPAVSLPAERAQSLALVLHELATNAAKHGALAAPGGRLAVSWRLDGEGALALDWAESRPGAGAGSRAGSGAGLGAGSGEGSGERAGGFGTGLLGRVVEAQLGGTIEHAIGAAGLACRIAFPLAAAGAGRRERPRGRAERGAGRGGAGPRVLIAEDEALVAMDLEATLGALGYRVFGVFPTVGEALASLEDDRPDVALLDANLREESARPLAERLVALGVPVVLATGYDSRHDIAGRIPSVARLTKPVGEAELAATLARVVAGA